LPVKEEPAGFSVVVVVTSFALGVVLRLVAVGFSVVVVAEQDLCPFQVKDVHPTSKPIPDWHTEQDVW